MKFYHHVVFANIQYVSQVVHVVETKGNSDENQDASSFISLFSSTPGKLFEESKNLKDEEFTCGWNKTVDYVSFTVKYGCWSSKDSRSGWSNSDIPIVHVEHDSRTTNVRKTKVFIDTRTSKRWSLAINREAIRDFTFEGRNNHNQLVIWINISSGGRIIDTKLFESK